jgi:hypothetical protein
VVEKLTLPHRHGLNRTPTFACSVQKTFKSFWFRCNQWKNTASTKKASMKKCLKSEKTV